VSASGDRPDAQAIPAGQGVQFGSGNVQHNYFIREHADQRRAGAQRIAGAGTVVVGDVPRKPAAFQPRAGLMEVLKRPPGSGEPVVVAFVGMPGAGKTQLAAAHARRRIAEGWRLVAWIDASDTASVLAGLEQVAADTGMHPAGGNAGSGRDAEKLAKRVRNWLQADGERRLVVFDNVADLDGLGPYIPSAGAAEVVITSNRQSAARMGTGVPVEEFTADEALQFLAGRLGRSDARAGELAGELGCLPLALAQAAGMISARGLDCGMYLERLQALPAQEYLRREEGQPYPRRAAESVLLSLEAVQAADPTGMSAGLMEFLAVLSPAGVHRDLLHAAGQARSRPAEPGQVDEALGRLNERSLLAFNVTEQAVTVHQLVMRVVRDLLARQGRLADACRDAGSVLEARASALDGSPDRHAVRNVIDQALALLGNATGTAGDIDDDLLMLRYHTASHMRALRYKMPEAIAIAEKLAADSERRFGQDDRATLEAKTLRALAYQKMGRYDEAIVQLQNVLADRERLLGPDDAGTLAACTNLGKAYADVGREADALPLHERALAGFERLRGPNAQATIEAMNNLAASYHAVHRSTAAIALMEQAVARQEQFTGPGSPGALFLRGNLASLYYEASRRDDARALLEQVLDAQEQAMGSDHPDIQMWRANLASMYREAGQRDKATALLEQVVDARKRTLGPGHPLTIDAQKTLSSLQRGDRTLTEVLLGAMRDPDPANHPGTRQPPRPGRRWRPPWRK